MTKLRGLIKSHQALCSALFGKDKEPVLRAPIHRISRPQEDPIAMSANWKEDGGLVMLRFLGKYEASFMVTDPDQF